MFTNTAEIQSVSEEYFKRHPEIELVYIFGSVAQARINILSDIDIAILLDTKEVDDRLYNYGYKAQILTDLMKLLRTNNVDLVILNEANPLLRHRVLYFGKLIYFKSERKRIQFQVETIDKYVDFKQLFKSHLKPEVEDD
ncbi:MAG: nucleotidyltransferase domain-containing protein [Candidatus Omnitrophota bacterium]